MKKDDKQKHKPRLIIGSFALAIEEISKVGTFGAAKYSENGWKDVPDGLKRYTDAMLRHYLREACGEIVDQESNYLHAAHLAWNAIARLELLLRANKQKEELHKNLKLNSPPYLEITRFDNNITYTEFKNKVKMWHKNNKIHRDNDLPAIEYADGTKMWYQHALLHRDNNLPAIIQADGTKEWWINGNRHRDNDLPAIEYAGGTKEWYQHGLLHRDNDLPAIEHADGTKEWYQNGKLHRNNILSTTTTLK